MNIATSHLRAAVRHGGLAVALAAPLMPGAGPSDGGGPVLPGDATWVGVAVIVAVALFGAAAFVGPVVLAQMPEDMPPTHSHDEPPGSSGRHGPLGEAEPPAHHPRP